MRLTCIHCTESAEGEDADALLDWYNTHKILHDLTDME